MKNILTQKYINGSDSSHAAFFFLQLISSCMPLQLCLLNGERFGCKGYFVRIVDLRQIKSKGAQESVLLHLTSDWHTQCSSPARNNPTGSNSNMNLFLTYTISTEILGKSAQGCSFFTGNKKTKVRLSGVVTI